MEKTEALNLFLLKHDSTQEEMEGAIEEKLFALKNDVLQKYMVPSLLRTKLQNIQPFMLAESALKHNGKSLSADLTDWTLSPDERIHFIEEYEKQISQLKLALMNAVSFDQLHQVIHALVITQEYYMVLFKMLFNEFSEALPEEVNTREIIDTGKLLLALKAGALDNKQTWEIEREIARIDKLQKLKTA